MSSPSRKWGAPAAGSTPTRSDKERLPVDTFLTDNICYVKLETGNIFLPLHRSSKGTQQAERDDMVTMERVLHTEDSLITLDLCMRYAPLRMYISKDTREMR